MSHERGSASPAVATSGDAAASAAGAHFQTTQWSVVLAARSDSSTRRTALEKLCRSYWAPIYHFLRRRGLSPHDAEDLTQGFFACAVNTDFLDRPDPERGRFRGYLVGALRRFMADEFERTNARKRGGGAEFLEWNSAAAEEQLAQLDAASAADPAAAYEKSWALTLLARALARLEVEQRAAGKTRVFDALKPFLTENAAPGDYAGLARQLGLTRGAVALAVHRLNQRYAELVRLEVAETVADPAEVKSEMEHLLRALRR
jgi:RNA polymerase sigma factor (sigma-70 family)